MKPPTTSACSWHGPLLWRRSGRNFPGALRQTQTLLIAVSLPPLDALAGSLINELDGLERDFIMVLEDYNTIHSRKFTIC